jgi:hypothetical protein
MSAKQIKENKKENSGINRKEIAIQLSQALPSLKDKLGEKKFEKRIKKAAKLLSGGVKSDEKKKSVATKPVPNKSKSRGTKSSSPAKKSAASSSK